ncbi:hypothetical protein [Parafrankia sp. EUN1f]|uniref:hypothetical protein n=1 Tax=Parafrankia sp. EUN1f TaxID=102897 RepID=UPI0001C4752D|nr:hypothetical protein [Parafrankia sp. EUN1f]EFC79469.1 putative diguanylate cyclase [Parafrankia sp. EUN1f]
MDHVGSAHDEAELEVVAVADRLRMTVSTSRACETRTVSVTASVGVALSGPATCTPYMLLRAADVGVYTAERQGRGRCQLFDETMLAQT